MVTKTPTPEPDAPKADNGFEGLQAIEAQSILVSHDAIMDDDLFDLLSQDTD